MPPPILRENSGGPAESKPRGANRSTKVAGKLKVLPEQPEDLGIIGGKSPARIFKPPKDYPESSGITGDSDDGDVEENDDSQETDVEVRGAGVPTSNTSFASLRLYWPCIDLPGL